VADALAALAGDDALRRDRGAAAAARVRSEYDLAPVAERWAALVRACAGR
jgi:glycosyltransferase involved in cell wall biosynthesis